jgi:hypothetical protein
LATSFLAKSCHLECSGLGKALIFYESEIDGSSIVGLDRESKQASSKISSQKA